MNRFLFAAILLILLPLSLAAASAAKGTRELSPVERAAIETRVKALKEKAPQGASLAAYLDCGVQDRTAEDSKVTIETVKGERYRFRGEAADAAETAATVLFDSQEVVFRLAGLDRTARYLLGISWWDYDAGGRTQTLLAASPDRRQVRIAIAAIGLPNQKISGEGPTERQASLPATFAKDGQMQLIVQSLAGPNAVVSELWIWQMEPEGRSH